MSCLDRVKKQKTLLAGANRVREKLNASLPVYLQMRLVPHGFKCRGGHTIAAKTGTTCRVSGTFGRPVANEYVVEAFHRVRKTFTKDAPRLSTSILKNAPFISKAMLLELATNLAKDLQRNNICNTTDKASGITSKSRCSLSAEAADP